ncbi:hypothetical protein PVW46_17055 [Mameliella sp. AT18]|uniref:hypothetical protein n=1 Tax=Mameliella sp. AT18 TaxID=3028385 RepID=UPI00084106A7|nr:hypothetical protein [Mameliella sp. AT18]MDD9731614.1 hypothetical protein [Mameliella sp. AT18]ODM47409.1 hypothetical protein A9320_22345 [Ruegeria sp. PBVC088]
MAVALPARTTVLGLPNRADNQIDLTLLSALLEYFESLLGTAIGYYEDDLADLPTASGVTDGSFAVVLNDATVSNRGVYQEQSDAWVKVASLPAGFSTTDPVVLSAAGSADVIAATANRSWQSGAFAETFTMQVAADNTGAVTVAIDGGSALALVDADGSALAAGFLTEDMVVDFRFDGTQYRLTSTSSAAATLAGAQAAQAAAEAAEATATSAATTAGTARDEAVDAAAQAAANATLAPAGDWDATSGSFPSGTSRGDYYIVSVPGTVDGQLFNAGDWLVSLADGASTSTFSGNWLRGDYGGPANQNAFESRAAAELANIPATVNCIRVKTPSGGVIDYVRNTRGAVGQALQTADGQWWMPAAPWMVTPNHWAENTSQGVTDMLAATQAAVDFAEDFAGTGVYVSGGRVQFLAERYLHSDEVVVGDSGVYIYGAAGDAATRVDNNNPTACTFRVVPSDSTGAASPTTDDVVEGGGINGLAMWMTADNPRAGAHIYVDRAARFQIQNVSAWNHYVQFHFAGVGENCTLEFCNASATGANIVVDATHNPTGGVLSGSALIKVTAREVVETHPSGAYQASGGGAWYTECNTVGIFQVNAVASGNGAVDCYYFDSFDGVEIVGGHSNGATHACFHFAPLHDAMPFTSFKSVGHHCDPKPGNTDYGVIFTDTNGAGGSTAGDIDFTGCGISGAQVSSLVINMQCRRFSWLGGYMKGANKSHVVINSDDADFVEIAHCDLFNANLDTGTYANAPAVHLVRGANVKIVSNTLNGGTTGIEVESTMTSAKVKDNQVTGMSGIDFLLPTSLPANVNIGPNEVSSSASIAQAGSTVDLHPGLEVFTFTGVAAVATIRASQFGVTNSNCSWDGRQVEIIAGASFTIRDESDPSGGNIQLSGGRNWAMLAGDRLRLEYDGSASLWKEIGRHRIDVAATFIADDDVTTYDLPQDEGFIRVYAENNANVWALFHYRADSGNEATGEIGKGSAVTLSTAVLAGTTGADAAVTISVNDGTLYIENRMGGPLGFRFDASDALRAA